VIEYLSDVGDRLSSAVVRDGIVILVAAIAMSACKVREPEPIRDPYADRFERSELGRDYTATGPGYAIVGGVLSAHGAHNHPLWLTRRLPQNVRIEFDCWSTERRGDIKVEVFGDGHSFDPDGGRYMATGYEVIFGGWYNTKSIIARLDEHGTELAQRADVKVIPNRHYHWRIERNGSTIKWFITEPGDTATSASPDAKPFLEYRDPKPLVGRGHEYLGFNNWETDTWFDNLVITPL